MQKVPAPPHKVIFVCTNCREAPRACCGARGGEALREALKQRARERGIYVRVARSGCLDFCEEGPNVVIMPDNRYFTHCSLEDVDAILDQLNPPRFAL